MRLNLLTAGEPNLTTGRVNLIRFNVKLAMEDADYYGRPYTKLRVGSGNRWPFMAVINNTAVSALKG